MNRRIRISIAVATLLAGTVIASLEHLPTAGNDSTAKPELPDTESATTATLEVESEDTASAASLPLSTLATETDAAHDPDLALLAAAKSWSLPAPHAAKSSVPLPGGTVTEDRPGGELARAPGTFLAGVVTEVKGAGVVVPVAGAMVRITPEEGISLDSVFVARTDDAGTFEMNGLSPGRHRIAVTAHGCAEWRRTISLGPEGCELSIELSAGLPLAGRIVGRGGHAIADARIVATVSRGIRRGATSDLRGEFFLDLLEGSEVELAVSAHGFADRTVRAPLPSAEPFEIELAEAMECAGEVLSAQSGAPLARARVEAWPVAGDRAESSAPLRSTTADDGLFRFGLDPRIAWRLRAEADGYEPEERIVEGGEFHRISLRRGTELALHLVDDGGEAVVHALVRFESREGVTVASASSDSEGRVGVAALPPEAERFRITHDRMLEKSVALAGIRSDRVERIELRRASSVRGTLLYDAAIAGDLTLSADARTWQTWPDPTGEFEFPGLEPGTYRLRYRARRDTPWLEQELRLSRGETIETTVDARGVW